MAIITLTEEVDNMTSVIQKEDKNNIDVLRINVPNTTVIGIGDEIIYQDESATTIFTGFVQNILIGQSKEITVFDKGSQLLQRVVNQVFTNQKHEEIIESISDDFGETNTHHD